MYPLDYVDDSRAHAHTTPSSAGCWISLYHVGRHEIFSGEHAVLETVVERFRLELSNGVFQVFQVLRGRSDLVCWGGTYPVFTVGEGYSHPRLASREEPKLVRENDENSGKQLNLRGFSP